MVDDGIELDLSEPENLDWLNSGGLDTIALLEDNEREERAFFALLDGIRGQLNEYGEDFSDVEIAIWIDALTVEEFRNARTQALKNSEGDYIQRLSDELIKNHLPVDVE